MTAKEHIIKVVISHFIVVKQLLGISNKMKHFDYKYTDKLKMSSRGRPYMQRDKYAQKGM